MKISPAAIVSPLTAGHFLRNSLKASSTCVLAAIGTQLVFSLDENWWVMDSTNASWLWDLSCFPPVKRTLPGVGMEHNGFTVGPQVRFLAMFNFHGCACTLWDLSCDPPRVTMLVGHCQELSQLVFSPDGRHLVGWRKSSRGSSSS